MYACRDNRQPNFYFNATGFQFMTRHYQRHLPAYWMREESVKCKITSTDD